MRAFTGNLNSSRGVAGCAYRFRASAKGSTPRRSAFSEKICGFFRDSPLSAGEIPKSKKIDMFGQIQAAILTLYKNQKITPVIVLDETRMASNAFLDDVSPLFNFHMDSENPYILCLIGLPRGVADCAERFRRKRRKTQRSAAPPFPPKACGLFAGAPAAGRAAGGNGAGRRASPEAGRRLRAHFQAVRNRGRRRKIQLSAARYQQPRHIRACLRRRQQSQGRRRGGGL
jgi:hypothetical protein